MRRRRSTPRSGPVAGALVLLLLAVPLPSAHAQLELRIDPAAERAVQLLRSGEVLLASPVEGLWSVAVDWEVDWPASWVHSRPSRAEVVGGWTILSGAIETPSGILEVRDAWRLEAERARCVRRFTWRGEETLERCTLSVRFEAPDSAGALPLLPGISYHGNPSGARHPERVPVHRGVAGELSLFEEHRYPMPFACIEWARGDRLLGAALHTVPSRPSGAHRADQWWSLGLAAGEDSTELLALSGPCATNGRRSVVKALQTGLMPYPDAWLDLRPDAVVEKTFLLEAFEVERRGSAFTVPLETSLELHRPWNDLDGLPSYDGILRDKLRFALSRYREIPEREGFEMYPDWVEGTRYVMGWAGQSAAPGYALLVLADRLGDPTLRERAARALDTLARAPVGAGGFPVRYDAEADEWSAPDPVSQGQAMETFALAIAAARGLGSIDTSRWEAFLREACRAHARRILREDWRPLSTAEAFLVSPLLRAARLFGEEDFRRAALHAAEHYASRHLDMSEPYWGGTLDASCEDKEGAWAGFQAFLAAYEDTGDPRHLRWAEHAMDVVLSFVVVWDIDLPGGRLADHGFRTRGWTVVSPQNQHLDVYAVVATPDIYRMGEHLGREDLKRLAAVMYRSCGQLIDPFGSQGEQIQHTNFAQSGDMSELGALRGGYSEGWTVFWITAHFLHAAARFEELGVDLDSLEDAGEGADVPAPLYRDPVFDGAADPVLVWNRARASWWMLYTQRRAKLDLPGVEWCHGTEIGIAESRDLGRSWRYLGTLPLEPLGAEYSFWAPDVVEKDGLYHLFVSYVPGVFADWSGDRTILRYSSRDLSSWSYEGRVPLSSDRCIDPSLFRMPDGAWRMWYKDEGHGSQTFAVESRDLSSWAIVEDPGVSELYGEAPKVFRLGGSFWLLKDPDSGLDVYRSPDLETWTYQGKILELPGKRNDDGTIGKHADVVVCGDRAFIYYFTHPGRRGHPDAAGVAPYAFRRSSIQAAELRVMDGRLSCDRDRPFELRLAPPDGR